MNTANYIKEVSVIDPDSKGEVGMFVFKHNQSGAMFAIDSSYIEQCFDVDIDPAIPDPFNEGQEITLFGL